MSNEKNKPAATIRDGALKATIWKNPSEKGHFYSVDIIGSYKVGDEFKETSSFSGSDILRLGFLAQRAYGMILELRIADADEAKKAAV